MAVSGIVSPSRCCRAILKVAGRNGHSVARTFVSASRLAGVAAAARCRFEVRRFAVVYRRVASRRLSIISISNFL
jgi:hypothetical protein